MIVVSSCSCLCPSHWSHMLNREWRCSWSRADRRCSNYIWVVNNFIAYYGVSYIRGLTVNCWWCPVSISMLTMWDIYIFYIWHAGLWRNTLQSKDVMWHQRSWSALVQIMACHLFDKAIIRTRAIFWQLDPQEPMSVKFKSPCKICHSRKCFWKCLQHGGYILFKAQWTNYLWTSFHNSFDMCNEMLNPWLNHAVFTTCAMS